MKYITVTTKDYLDALSKNLDVITSDEISSQDDFYEVLILKTENILEKIKINEILIKSNLPLYLSNSLNFNLQFLIRKKIFENEIIIRSGRKLYKIDKKNSKKKTYNFFVFKLIKKTLFNVIDNLSINFFFILLYLRSYYHKENILASYPGSGLGQFLLDKKKISNSLFLVPDNNQFLIKKIFKFIFGSQNIPFYPRKLQYKSFYSLNTFIDLKIYNLNFNDLNIHINDWINQRKRDFLIAKKVAKILKPTIFISQQSLDQYAIIADTFNTLKIPSLLITHGSHIINFNHFAKKEWKNHSLTFFDGPFDFTAIQSPAAKHFYSTENLKSKALDFGPLILWNVDKNNKSPSRKQLFHEFSEKKILLYASTPKFIDGLRPLIYETENEYVKNLITLINSLSKRKDLHLVIRHREREELNCDDLLKILPKSDNYKIYPDGKFEDYLIKSDLLISYSSTTIEQALFANKKVLLWDSLGRYKHIDEISINSYQVNGIWYASQNNLMKNLNDALNFNHAMSKNTYQKIYVDYKKKINNESDIFKYLSTQ